MPVVNPKSRWNQIFTGECHHQGCHTGQLLALLAGGSERQFHPQSLDFIKIGTALIFLEHPHGK